MINARVLGISKGKETTDKWLASIKREVSAQQRRVTQQTLEAIRQRLSVWSGQTQNSITVSHGSRVTKMARRDWSECAEWRTHAGGSTNDVPTGQNLEKKANYAVYQQLLNNVSATRPFDPIWITADSRAGRNGLWLGMAPAGAFRHLENRQCGVRFRPRMGATALDDIVRQGAKGTAFSVKT